MKQLVYFIAFGSDCIRQMELCIDSIRMFSDIEILIVTDTDYEGANHTIHVAPPPPPANGDSDPVKAQYHAYFTYRTNIYKLIDINKWDRIWYMDTDFLLKGDLFSKYNDAEHIYLCREPKTYISDIHFNNALTLDEINRDPFKMGINAGLYTVPKLKYSFFPFYHSEVIKMLVNSRRAWLTEQHILNMIYVRHADAYNIRTFAEHDIGFPAKKVKGELASHFACIPFEKKLTQMQNEAVRGIVRN